MNERKNTVRLLERFNQHLQAASGIGGKRLSTEADAVGKLRLDIPRSHRKAGVAARQINPRLREPVLEPDFVAYMQHLNLPN